MWVLLNVWTDGLGGPYRLYILEENRGFKASDVGEKFEGWVKACVNRESLIKTTSDKEHYEEIYGECLCE